MRVELNLGTEVTINEFHLFLDYLNKGKLILKGYIYVLLSIFIVYKKEFNIN